MDKENTQKYARQAIFHIDKAIKEMQIARCIVYKFDSTRWYWNSSKCQQMFDQQKQKKDRLLQSVDDFEDRIRRSYTKDVEISPK